ncbi:Clavaminate synthase-like protein [Aspergillus violaceofuscus CBS 115571]|uniref:Clavaminate synthase-like protein n=1 Tax=Aspergillus violaceofuscus (strain CBS 115571) TaxID=1450538 RepID=A0A2V5ILW5_ASPV1|nr:Clavaminate synthase-like protein [Aspergillus violaceofuscus CBS 115571]
MSLPESSVRGDFSRVPVIDLTNLRSPQLDERRALAREIHDACMQVGFFYITNHGISQATISALHEAACQFFALPDDRKSQYSMANSKKFRGFMPLYAEQMTGLELQQPDPDNVSTPGAYSESFDVGYELAADPQREPHDSLPSDDFGLYGDNQWPSEDELPGFRRTYIEYFAEALTLCRSLMRIFALALDLPEEFFDPMMEYPGATSRMLHYPPQSANDTSRIGLGAHTDYECITILSQDKVPALQVRNSSEEWITVQPLPNTLVVNIADCLSMWTNRRFKSTVHRVINITGEERYTIPFFFGVDYNTTVSVLPSCISEDSPACQKPFEAGEWVRRQLAATYIGYGQRPPAEQR